MNCPECGSEEIRISRHAHAKDMLYRICGREAYRCRECRHRFYGKMSPALEAAAYDRSSKSHRWPFWLGSSRQRRRFRRAVGYFAIFALAFLIFWFFLRFITTERGPSDETPASFLISHASGRLA
jgi:hypothetical protein